MNDFQIFKVKVALASIIGWLTALMGGWDKVMEILVIFMVLDYLTGVGLAIKEHKVNSKIGGLGLLKKATIFVVIIIAAQLDQIIENPANLFRTAAALFYIANEGISIAENLGGIGLPLPKFITGVLEQLRDKNDEGEITHEKGN